MVTQPKRSAKKATKPATPDLKKGRKAVDRLIRENVDWLKTMAKR